MSEEILNALCEYHGRCPKCFRWMEGANCPSCDNYYCECSCIPLTKEEIIHNNYLEKTEIRLKNE